MSLREVSEIFLDIFFSQIYFRTSEKFRFFEVLFGLLFSGINARSYDLPKFFLSSKLNLDGIEAKRDQVESARFAKFSNFFRQVEAFFVRHH